MNIDQRIVILGAGVTLAHPGLLHQFREVQYVTPALQPPIVEQVLVAAVHVILATTVQEQLTRCHVQQAGTVEQAIAAAAPVPEAGTVEQVLAAAVYVMLATIVLDQQTRYPVLQTPTLTKQVLIIDFMVID